MSLTNWCPHRTGGHYWDVWDWPQSLLNQNFGLDMLDTDWVVSPFIRSPTHLQRNGFSSVTNDTNKFQVRLDCSHFKPEEISVKTVDKNVVIHGKHEEKLDKHGWVQREFTRRYTLPTECEAERVVSSLNQNGVLTIEAPKKALEPIKDNERVVPINVVHESSHAIKHTKH